MGEAEASSSGARRPACDGLCWRILPDLTPVRKSAFLAVLLLADAAAAQTVAVQSESERVFYCAAFYRNRVATLPAIAIESRNAIEDSAADLRTKIELEHKIKLDAREQMLKLRDLERRSAEMRAHPDGDERERVAGLKFEEDSAACQGAIEPFARYQSSKQCMATIETTPGRTVVDCARESGHPEAKPILEHCGRMAECVGFSK